MMGAMPTDMPTEYRGSLTDWFCGKVKPERSGVYQTQDAGGRVWFNFYSRERNAWHWGTSRIFDATRGPYYFSGGRANRFTPKDRKEHLVKWRGLSRDFSKA